MHSLENDRNVIIKAANKGSSIVVWDRLDYLAEAQKQLSDSNTYYGGSTEGERPDKIS